MIVDSQAALAARIAACWLPAGLLYFLFGQSLNLELGEPGARVHFLYGLFLVALALGGVVSDQAVQYFGGNGWLLFLAAASLSLAFPPRAAALFAASAAGLLLFLPVDLHVERMRNVSHETDLGDPSTDISEKKRVAFDHLDHYPEAFDRLAWNRRGMTFMYRDEKLGSYLGIINVQAEHQLPFRSENEGRQVHHSLLKPEQEILLIGAGSGRSLWAMPPGLVGKNIYAVERDGNTVRLMKENGFNPNIPRVNYLAYDGRGFLEQTPKKWDWIVLESSVHQRNTSPFQLFQPYNLYTREAIRAYWDHLKEGGTLVVEINKPEDGSRRAIAGAVIEEMENIRDPSARRLNVLKNPAAEGNPGPLLMHLRKGGEPLTPESLRMAPGARVEGPEDFPSRPCLRRYSDDAPFLDWMCMSPSRHARMIFYTFWLFALLAAGYAVHEWITAGQGKGFAAVKLVFVCQSLAHCFLFLAVSYVLRASFQDEIGTFYVFTYTTTLIASAASFYVYRRLSAKGPVPFAPVAGAMAVSFALLLLLPRLDIAAVDSWVLRFALMTAAAGPFYFFSSLMFHVNLQRAAGFRGGVKQAFMIDALALLPAYLLVPWILFEHGLPALFAAAALLYGLMLGVMLWFEPEARIE
jgi:precorrin-6B methylase 2